MATAGRETSGAVAAEQGTNQSLERAAAVLRAFSLGSPELKVAEVARRAGLGVSSTSRLLASLEALDFVERDRDTGLYRLGAGLITLAGAAVNQNPVHYAARMVAQQLAARLGLGANVAIRRGHGVFYLCNFEGSQAPKGYSLVGQQNPLHATGLGKCLLTGLDGDTRRALLDEPFPAYTENTITGHDDLDRELSEVARRGYAIEREELALARACLAAPIRGSSGAVVAALSVNGPLSAIDLDRRETELAASVIEAADSISVSLGYLGPQQSVARVAARS